MTEIKFEAICFHGGYGHGRISGVYVPVTLQLLDISASKDVKNHNTENMSYELNSAFLSVKFPADF